MLGTVIKLLGKVARVRVDEEKHPAIECYLRGKIFAESNDELHNEIAVGDRVVVSHIDEDQHKGVLHRVEQDLKPVPPRMIYLMMGINDLFRYVPQNRILANYEDILERINVLAPDCKVLVHGLLPIDEPIAPQPIASATIRSLNAGLKKLCRKRGITYIDTFDTFDQDGDGRLDESYSRDGLHLNAKGYFAWKKLLEIQGHATK